MTATDPWTGLHKASSLDYYSAMFVARQLNPNRIDVSWTRGATGLPGLLLVYGKNEGQHCSMPRFQNIRTGENVQEHTLIIELMDLSMKGIFLQLCLDIISTLQGVSRDKLRAVTISRLEQWSQFLRPGHSRLSPEMQKGLIGELLFLERYAIPVLGNFEAISGWDGPESGARDFSYGQTYVEAKTKRGSGTPRITISSANQLQSNDSERVFLYVVEISPAPEGSGRTLPQHVERVRQLLSDRRSRAIFDAKLSSVGFLDVDDYSDYPWSEGQTYFYRVAEGFPRITSDMLNQAISHVIYDIDIDGCNDFLADKDDVIRALKGLS